MPFKPRFVCVGVAAEWRRSHPIGPLVRRTGCVLLGAATVPPDEYAFHFVAGLSGLTFAASGLAVRFFVPPLMRRAANLLPAFVVNKSMIFSELAISSPDKSLIMGELPSSNGVVPKNLAISCFLASSIVVKIVPSVVLKLTVFEIMVISFWVCSSYTACTRDRLLV
jgi:hypothetical protein